MHFVIIYSVYACFCLCFTTVPISVFLHFLCISVYFCKYLCNYVFLCTILFTTGIISIRTHAFVLLSICACLCFYISDMSVYSIHPLSMYIEKHHLSFKLTSYLLVIVLDCQDLHVYCNLIAEA